MEQNWKPVAFIASLFAYALTFMAAKGVYEGSLDTFCGTSYIAAQSWAWTLMIVMAGAAIFAAIDGLKDAVIRLLVNLLFLGGVLWYF